MNRQKLDNWLTREDQTFVAYGELTRDIVKLSHDEIRDIFIQNHEDFGLSSDLIVSVQDDEGDTFLFVDDYAYQFDDPEADRTFMLVIPTNGKSYPPGIDFEELP
jgi:hypothetical protein